MKNVLIVDLEGCKSKGAWQFGYSVYDVENMQVVESNYYNINHIVKKYDNNTTIQKRQKAENNTTTRKNVQNIVMEIVEKYNIDTVMSYNLFSDIVTMTNTFTKKFMEKLQQQCKFIDLMVLAICNIVKTVDYINYYPISKNNCIKHGVEYVYNYITKTQIIESHNAEQDCLLECAILEYLIKYGLKEYKKYNCIFHAWNSISKYIKDNKDLIK